MAAVGMSISIRLARSISEDILIFGLFLVVALNCAFAIIVLAGGIAQMQKLSSEILQDIRCNINQNPKSLRKLSRFEFRWERRFYLACPDLKAKIGSVSYMDGLTPLNLLDQANDLTINFLLLS